MYKFKEEVNVLIEELFNDYSITKYSREFYKHRILKFFDNYMGECVNRDKPLNAITYFDLNIYLKNLDCSPSEKVNIYSSLKRFFEYTYLKNKTKEIISQVERPFCERKSKIVLEKQEYIKIKEFIVSRDNDIKKRLILGLFLFTGLSRKYIASIRNNQFLYIDGVYKLKIWKEKEEIILPLKSELQLLVYEYCNNFVNQDNHMDKVKNIGENGFSTYINGLTYKIIGKKCTPTILSNTFIKLALSKGNYIWEVSKLTLESVSTIEEHVIDVNDLENKQTSILNSF